MGDSTASGNDAIALGRTANAKGNNSFAAGVNTQAGTSGVAIGGSPGDASGIGENPE